MSGKGRSPLRHHGYMASLETYRGQSPSHRLFQCQFNCHVDPFNAQWNKGVLKILASLPKYSRVRESSSFFGETHKDLFAVPIPITALIADQQSALFGECCYQKGDVKCTIGTGAFIDLNTGKNPVASLQGLLPLIAWKLNGRITYMTEGYVNMAGAAIDWLSEGLNIIKEAQESEAAALKVKDTGGLFVVPAFSGLSTPYWILSQGDCHWHIQGTQKEHIIRATLESIVYQCKDILNVMKRSRAFT